MSDDIVDYESSPAVSFKFVRSRFENQPFVFEFKSHLGLSFWPILDAKRLCGLTRRSHRLARLYLVLYRMAGETKRENVHARAGTAIKSQKAADDRNCSPRPEGGGVKLQAKTQKPPNGSAVRYVSPGPCRALYPGARTAFPFHSTPTNPPTSRSRWKVGRTLKRF